MSKRKDEDEKAIIIRRARLQALRELREHVVKTTGFQKMPGDRLFRIDQFINDEESGQHQPS